MYRIENVPLSRLKEYENNPRNSDLAVEKVAVSIKRLGFLFPIVVDAEYIIVCGHARKRACEKLGIQLAPCIKVEDLTEEQLNYFRLIDNRTAEYAEWDFSKLESELQQIDLSVETNQLVLEAFDLTDFAGLQELDDLPDPIPLPSNNFMDAARPEPEEAPPFPPAPRTVPSFPPAPDSPESAAPYGPEQAPAVPVAPATPEALEVPETPRQDVRATRPAPVLDTVQVASPDLEAGSAKPGNKLRLSLGKVRFFISDVEAAMMDKAYGIYLDSGSQEGFVTWLLGSEAT